MAKYLLEKINGGVLLRICNLRLFLDQERETNCKALGGGRGDSANLTSAQTASLFCAACHNVDNVD